MKKFRLPVRAMHEDTGIVGFVEYVLDLGENGWLMVGLSAPLDENIELLDEVTMQPVIRSIEVIGPVQFELGE